MLISTPSPKVHSLTTDVTGRTSAQNLSSSHPCSGYCAVCGRDHGLGEGRTQRYCLELMDKMACENRIDFQAERDASDPRCSTDYLFGPARGQMFGVMEYVDQQGKPGRAQAFSGQYNGLWNVPGWVGAVVDDGIMEELCAPVERKIKELGRRIGALALSSSQRKQLVRERREMSRRLMGEIHDLYHVGNFRGEMRPLKEIFLNAGGMPTGTGECCAPKLLQHAVRHGYTPLGISEFYWGRENRSRTKEHGVFYPACQGKCRPILGFMLCGLPGC